jgi:hypothetical protein
MFQDLSTQDRASKSRDRDYTYKDATPESCHDKQYDCYGQKRSPVHKIEEVRIQAYDSSIYQLTRKEPVVVDLVPPHRAYENQIANDQQDGTNECPEQKLPLIFQGAAIIHLFQPNASLRYEIA